MSSAAPAPRIEIALAGASELDAVMATMATAFDPAFGEAWTRPQCEGILGLPGVWLLIAREAGRTAGFALARAIVDEAELLLLAVPPAMRRRGIGSMLLEAVAAGAATREATRLHLEMRDNNPARALYAGAGFVEVGRRRAYYRGQDGRRFDAITLSRVLAETKIRSGAPLQP